MLRSMQNFFSPPVFEDDEKSRVAAILNSIIWIVIITGTLYTIATPFFLGQYVSGALTATIVIISLISRQLMVRGHLRFASITLLAVFQIILTLSIIVTNGVFGASYFGMVMTTVLAGILLGGRGAYTMAVINALTGLGIMLAQDFLPPAVIPQLSVTFWSSLLVYVFFTAALLQASSKGFDKLLENSRTSERQLTEKNRELEEIGASLEDSVAARTAELDAANQRNERRLKQLEAMAQVSRAISQAQSLDSLLPQIAQVISQQFGFYHVGIFLLDSNHEFAVLLAANSEGGQKMLARGHKLRVGRTGIVGYASGSGLPRIALDTGADAIYFDNPDLPETRSEMALPLLRSEKHVIGVLDVQSKEANAFGQEDIHTLTILAEQVAIAIDNARLFEELQKTIHESEAVYRQGLKTGWAKFARSQNLAGVHRIGMKTNFITEPLHLPQPFETSQTGNAHPENGGTIKSSQITLPMKLRDEVVGVLTIRADDDREWSDDDMDIIDAIVGRAALSIENARLLEESRRIAEREQVIGDIAAKIGAGTEIEAILRTAVRELGTQIRGAQVTVEIGGGEE